MNHQKPESFSWFRRFLHPHNHQHHSTNQAWINHHVNEKNNNSVSFIEKVVSVILDSNLIGEPEKVMKANKALIEFEQPLKLESKLNLQIKENPMSEDELLEFCKKLIKHSVKTTHPHFFNQLYGGINQYGLAGAWLSDALNTSQATYEIAPVFTIIERKLIEYCGLKCGWKKKQIDGIFAPGGSMSNIYGMMLARHQMFPQSKENGILSLGQLVLFCSDNAHYSMVKGAIWMGLGSEAVIKVATNERGKMIPEKLEQAIKDAKQAGKIPFCVVATSSTTVLGAFDPLAEISVICKRHSLWMHVDGALGGTFLFSSRYRSLLEGIQEADSMTWNLHKLAGVPLQCSLFLTRHKHALRQCNSISAEYIFQNDKYYDVQYDTGDKSIQCGRKVDSLKAWLTLASRGEKEWDHLVDNLVHMNRYITDKLRDRPGFKLVLPQFEGSTVSFWFIPKSLRDKQPIDPQNLHKVCPMIKERMMSRGSLMINYQPLTCKGLVNFFRLSLTCIPPPSIEDMDFVIEEIEHLGEDIIIR